MGKTARGCAVDITFHPGWWRRNSGIDFGEPFFFEPDFRIEADRQMRKTLYERFGDLGFGDPQPKPRPIIGTDLLAAGFLYSGVMGCPIRYAAGNSPEVVCACLNPEQIGKLRELDVAKTEIWRRTVRQIEYLEEKFGYLESHLNLQGILNIGLDLRGSDLYVDFFEEPELAKELFKECARVSVEIGKYLAGRSKVLSHGVTAITAQVMPDVYLTSNCTVEMVSLENYLEFLWEHDQQLAANFQPFGVHHCGQTMEHVAAGYAKINGMQFAEVGAGSDIAAVRRMLPEVFLNLRYSPVKLKTANTEEIHAEVARMAAAAGDNFSISCVGIDAQTGDSQIREFVQAVQSLK